MYSAHSADQTRYTRALQEFDAALKHNVQEVTLQPGDMVFVDNRHVQHGRRAFEPWPIIDERRWLRRIFIAQDPTLKASVMASSERILDSRYMAK